MNILGIDTTAKIASVAVKNSDNIYLSSDINNITHSEKLLPLIHKALEKSNTKFEDINLLATTNGPGSFTGCRIGVSTIKALSHPKKIDILAVSSLELIAFEVYQNSNENNEKYICPILDARNNRIYYAVYKIYIKNKKLYIENVFAISNDDLLTALDNISNFSSCIFAGDCTIKFTDDILNYTKDNNLNYTCLDYEIIPEAKYLINYYENISDDILPLKMYNTYNLDVVYARVSQAERMKNEEHQSCYIKNENK
ncbi:MAG: tRNA (adenosine(37)-N6)-threonylcarbamoyltransferase complex dimerization subunit type 1 TsaB [Clostridia bacterium]|nr:tRNA (adenosine(37)-N6)-threonylcarbamoyltransferase complex dimerization subunit type 1 TsaB [Clostridia bacterium]MDD4386892.1 tRNA (adenosine(37)-N6)-threonylcarbamoyltransferase complex dimerization subunit type 1 TsaB [Clostridia bacterium]